MVINWNVRIIFRRLFFLVLVQLTTGSVCQLMQTRKSSDRFSTSCKSITWKFSLHVTFRNHFIQESFFWFKPPTETIQFEVFGTLASWQRSDSLKEKHKFGRNKWIYAQLNVLLWDFLTSLCSREARAARWSLTWLCSLSRAHACMHAHRPARTHTFPVLSGRSSGRHSHERVVPSLSVFGLAPPLHYSAAKANIPSVMEQQFTWAHTSQLI